MNKRYRQEIRAMLMRTSPLHVVSIHKEGEQFDRIVLVEPEQMEDYEAKYGDDMKIIFSIDPTALNPLKRVGNYETKDL